MIRALLVVAFVAVGLMAAVFSRFAGFLLYTWFALFRPQEWAWGALNSYRLSLVIFLFFVVPSVATGVLPNLTHRISAMSGIFLAWVLASQIGAVEPATAWYWTTVLASTQVAALLGVTLIANRQRLILTLAVIGTSLGLHTAKYGVGFLIRGGARFTEGTGGMFGDINDFALAAARVLFLLIAVAQLTRNRVVKAGFWTAAPLTVLCVVSTFSRGGFLALAGGVVAFALVQKRRLVAVAALVFTVALTAVLVPIPEGYFDRLNTIRTYEDEGEQSALARIHCWRIAIRMAKDHPLGVGLKNYEANYDLYDTSDGHFGTRRAVHNTYLQALSETGYPGLAIFLLLFTLVFHALFRVRRRAKRLASEEARFCLVTSNALIASNVAFAIGGTFASALLNDLNWFTFGLVAALDRVSSQWEQSRGSLPDVPVTAAPPSTEAVSAVPGEPL